MFRMIRHKNKESKQKENKSKLQTKSRLIRKEPNRNSRNVFWNSQRTLNVGELQGLALSFLLSLRSCSQLSLFHKPDSFYIISYSHLKFNKSTIEPDLTPKSASLSFPLQVVALPFLSFCHICFIFC